VTSEGFALGDADQPADTRTEAQRRFEEQMLRRHARDLKAGKKVPTHKERVEKLNEYFANLSEHHDVPKVDGSW